MKNAVLALRFGTEIALLAGAYWAGLELSWVVGVLAIVVVAVLWGVLVAPKASRRASDPLRLGMEVVLFGVVGVALVAAGHPVAGTLLIVVGVGIAAAVRRVAPDS